MIDHFNLPVLDIGASREFYVSVLYELGHPFLMQDADAIGFGKESWEFGIVQSKDPIPSIHLAFRANSHNAVQGFYQAALNAGARCNGLPGFRPQYGPDYYSAFVYDLDGHNIEAVCRGGN